MFTLPSNGIVTFHCIEHVTACPGGSRLSPPTIQVITGSLRNRKTRATAIEGCTSTSGELFTAEVDDSPATKMHLNKGISSSVKSSEKSSAKSSAILHGRVDR